MRTVVLLLAGLVITASQHPANCQTINRRAISAISQPTRLAKSLDDYFTRAEAFGFSGSVIVARNGTAILRKGYGFADRRTQQRNTPETVFGLSSADKQIIAAGVMRLTELNRVSVTDTLGRFFPDLPRDKAGITLRQLMSHTSGVPDEYWDDYKTRDRAHFVEAVLKKPLDFTPGSDWSYSNVNFWILEDVIARASAMPYEQFLKKYLFDPAGMTSTGFPSLGWKGKIVASYKPWTFDIPNDRLVDAQPLLTRERWNWQLMTTVDDLFKWYLALRNNTVISAASKQALFTPVMNDYGYGWNVVKTRRNTTLVHHGGAGDGVGMTATIRLWPDEDIAVIILANSTNPALTSDAIGQAVESIIFGGRADLPPAVEPLLPSFTQLVGKYRFTNGGEFSIERVAYRRLVLQTSDSKAMLRLLFPDLDFPIDSISVDTRAERALSGAFAGNLTLMRSIVLPREDLTAREAQMSRLVKRMSSMGDFRGLRTVYQRSYDRDGIPELQSFIVIQMTKGDALLRVVHLSSGEIFFNPQSLPPILEMPLAPTVGNALTTWNFLWSNATEISARNVSGKTVLTVRGGRGAVEATRQ